MDKVLEQLIGLFDAHQPEIADQVYQISFSPSASEIALLVHLEAQGRIQQTSFNGTVVSASSLKSGEPVVVELSIFQLEADGFYENFHALLSNQGLIDPKHCYLLEEKVVYPGTDLPGFFQGYLSAIELRNCLAKAALFTQKDDDEVHFLFQEKNATKVEITLGATAIKSKQPDPADVTSFCSEMAGHSERKKIYLKEIIDFLNGHEEPARFKQLYLDFDGVYQKCQAAYGFFLSDFTYSKLKLELESAILDYSKNIRSIINDSQTKLVAIPAAFLVASSQLDLDHPLANKNILILISSLAFSLLIEIFIRNQESSLAIFIDNVANYKKTFALKNHQMDQRENKQLQQVIREGFNAIDLELIKQRQRLTFIRIINWGVTLIVLGVICAFHFGTENGQKQLKLIFGN